MVDGKVFNYMSKWNAFLFDCDGVLWRGSRVFPYSRSVIQELRSRGKKIAYVTNNNSVTRIGLMEKLRSRGFSVEIEECFCTSYLAAKYLKENGLSGRVYMVGNNAMAQELENFGIEYFGLGRDDFPDHATLADMELPSDESVEAVLVGYDYYISLKKITYAMTFLRNPKVKFVATNLDSVFPLPNNRLAPGSGTIVQTVATASGRTPIVAGKPSGALFEIIQNSINVCKEECCMIGDRLDSDILFANNSGIDSLLVFSGVTSKEQYEKHANDGYLCGNHVCKPTISLDSIEQLLGLLNSKT